MTFVFVALVGPRSSRPRCGTVIARRIGKERAFAMASVLFTAAAATLVFAVWVPGAWIYASVAVAGIAYAGLQSLPMAMLPDVISHDERTSGPDRQERSPAYGRRVRPSASRSAPPRCR